MNHACRWSAIVGATLIAAALIGCGTVPVKRYYLLNYLPSPPQERLSPSPYPYVLRLKEFDIEAAYARPQIVYRQSPFELQYDYYRAWAVKPTQMVTDLVAKHLVTANLVSSVVRRYDEGAAPQFELSGNIEAIEEYDSDKAWFAHVALRLELLRLRDGKVVYSRRFDNRKQLFQNQPEMVIKEMSAVVEYIMNQAVRDMDVVFSHETGAAPDTSATARQHPDSTGTAGTNGVQ
jgi:ABC-type uncharacterized transport system auxiliary subunit